MNFWLISIEVLTRETKINLEQHKTHNSHSKQVRSEIFFALFVDYVLIRPPSETRQRLMGDSLGFLHRYHQQT